MEYFWGLWGEKCILQNGRPQEPPNAHRTWGKKRWNESVPPNSNEKNGSANILGSLRDWKKEPRKENTKGGTCRTSFYFTRRTGKTGGTNCAQDKETWESPTGKKGTTQDVNVARGKGSRHILSKIKNDLPSRDLGKKDLQKKGMPRC